MQMHKCSIFTMSCDLYYRIMIYVILHTYMSLSNMQYCQPSLFAIMRGPRGISVSC